MNRISLGLIGLIAFGWAGAAQACTPGQADFDSCFFTQLGQMQDNNSAPMAQTWNAYLQAYGPQLQQAYQQWGYQSGASFEQFAYYMLMSANGTDVQGALRAQQQNFEGLQAAHNTQVETGQIYIDTMQQNSDIALGAVENYDLGAVRGNVVVNGPGGPVELPYSNVQVGQTVNANGYTYVMTQQGYAVWTGYGWQLVR